MSPASLFLAGIVWMATLPVQTTSSFAAPATTKSMDVKGARLPWVEQGQGEAVVFVNPAVADHRSWDKHLAMVAGRNYRAIAYSQRYFGTDPWDDNWPPFGMQTHADDLASFIRGLSTGPVHLVGWSYSGPVILQVAYSHPELVKSTFVFEPSSPGHITDPEVLKAIGDDAGSAFGASAKASQEADLDASVRELIDGVTQRKGYFDALPPPVKAVQLENARTLPLLFSDKTPSLSCDQLGGIRSPVAIVRTAEVRPFFRLIAETAARCMPTAQYLIVPSNGHTHMWPGADVADFTAKLVEFLKSR